VMRKVASDLGIERGFGTTLASVPRALPLADVGHRERLHWLQVLTYKATARGTVYLKKNGKRLWPLSDRVVYKNLWLKFVLETDTPYPYEVKWQVVNTGREASAAGQLRGGFYEAEANVNSVRWERTLYSGTHLVEGLVLKNGLCVARTTPIYVRVL